MSRGPMSLFSASGRIAPPLRRRAAVISDVVRDNMPAALLLLVGGPEALQTAAIASALPFSWC
ncbi:hypothetical protein [Methylobacterium sp. R2-1]|uniref:hypothetical protein n=1 Tax=Methylobacterium sp. R2-1 TaxID=2587064 RepID=UPI00160C2CDE|nr:hypothetical protein [Methylobacterium sp. R2-1]MBB2963946.1 choline-glycine betaine transporter [Methylobacterium sp. R2-1]